MNKFDDAYNEITEAIVTPAASRNRFKKSVGGGSSRPKSKPGLFKKLANKILPNVDSRSQKLIDIAKEKGYTAFKVKQKPNMIYVKIDPDKDPQPIDIKQAKAIIKKLPELKK